LLGEFARVPRARGWIGFSDPTPLKRTVLLDAAGEQEDSVLEILVADGGRWEDFRLKWSPAISNGGRWGQMGGFSIKMVPGNQ
jgi:hypothetical protein